MGMPGHLFVVHGDLTTLSCDGVLVPSDAEGSVSDWWWEMFGLTPTGPTWAPLPRGTELADCPTGPRAFELVDTVTAGDDVQMMLDGVRAGLEALAARLGEPRAGQVVPLVAMPVPRLPHDRQPWGLDHHPERRLPDADLLGRDPHGRDDAVLVTRACGVHDGAPPWWVGHQDGGLRRASDTWPCCSPVATPRHGGDGHGSSWGSSGQTSRASSTHRSMT